MSENASGKQVSIRFHTKLGSAYRVPDASLSVPANVTRYGLSTIINHLLQLEPPRPFDFLVKDELLRQTLEVALLSHAISTEAVVDVEYTFVTLPPNLETSVPHKDWVSALAALDSAVCSGSCDGVLSTFSSSGELQSSCHAHEGGVNALAAPADENLVVTGGKDGHACVWRIADGKAEPLARLEGHRDAVQDAVTDGTADACATSSWDRTIRVWDCRSAVSEAEAASGHKRRKTGKTASVCMGAPHMVTQSRSTLEGHTQVVSGLAWPSALRSSHLFSGSWDHTLKRWDPSRGTCVQTISTGKAIQCIAACARSGNVVAAGASDGVLRLWDVRGGSETLAIKGYKSHSGLISSVSWSPHSEHILVTGAYDNSVRMWDIRTSIPLATLEHHSDKVLAVGWISNETVMSGGADSMLHIYTARNEE